MCRRTTCKQCGKPSWAGCGAHVEQVLGDVPKSQRCSCRETGRPATKSSPTKSAWAKSSGTESSGVKSSGVKSSGTAAAEPTTTMARFKAWLKQ